MHWAALLLVVLLCFLALVEIGTRLLVRRISRVEGRAGAEYEAAIAPAPASGKPVVLLLGNSLLDAALDFPRLRNEAAERWDVRRFVVENTSYYDWHYGIRRLFAGGARPQVVMLMLNGGQLASSGSRGEYSAYTLVSRDDIFHFAEDLNLHPTNAANVVFANLSMFYGLRSEIRKVLIGKVLPDLPSLTVRLLPAPLEGAGRDRVVLKQRTESEYYETNALDTVHGLSLSPRLSCAFRKRASSNQWSRPPAWMLWWRTSRETSMPATSPMASI